MRKYKKLFRPRRPLRENRINEDITEPEVRVITDNGAQVMSTENAIKLAQEKGEDLVEITKSKDIPIVKIINYGKFKFEKAKKEKESKKKQKVIQIKEIKMGPKIDIGDFNRKCSMAENFITEGDNVKVTMRFRGREMAHTELGYEKLVKFSENLKENAVVEKEPSLEGRIMFMVLRPKSKKVVEKIEESEQIDTSESEDE
ncbi:MAG: translation initiation factor IF-3 [Spirochaetia bacterium]|nr:translation initiation factor IF-3 [Spirochaetia bacterium]